MWNQEDAIRFIVELFVLKSTAKITRDLEIGFRWKLLINWTLRKWHLLLNQKLPSHILNVDSLTFLAIHLPYILPLVHYSDELVFKTRTNSESNCKHIRLDWKSVCLFTTPCKMEYEGKQLWKALWNLSTSAIKQNIVVRRAWYFFVFCRYYYAWLRSYSVQKLIVISKHSKTLKALSQLTQPVQSRVWKSRWNTLKHSHSLLK